MPTRVKPKIRWETDELVRTFQLRLYGAFPALDDLAERYQRAKRHVYGQAKLQQKSFVDFKTDTCAAFRLPTRIFNALQTDLTGMVKSAQEKAKFDLAQAEERIEQITKRQAKLQKVIDNKAASETKRRNALFNYHAKRESKDRFTARLVGLQQRTNAAYPSICFGSRRLFTAQHYRQDNGYATHDAWLANWRAARADQVLVVGSNDERSGNSTCKARVNEDNSVNLKLNLGTGHLALDKLVLPHGHADWIDAILAADAEYAVSQAWQKETRRLIAGLDKDAVKAVTLERLKQRKGQAKRGNAITYRFAKDHYGWRIFITVTKNLERRQPDFGRGAIGLDLNDQHVSRSRVGPDGRLVDSRDLPLLTQGRSSGQRRADVHQLACELVQEAGELGLPLVIERLDFAAKKRRLREVGCATAARRLSSFAYSRFAVVLKSHARRQGVAVVEVNPAYTSVIGAALHAVPHGLTVHAAAAMAIARRGMRVEETIPEQLRVWCYGRAPRAMERPSSLRRKGTVELLWPGWVDLAKAVHQARDEGKAERRRTGSQRRKERRDDAALRDAGRFFAAL